MTKGIARERPKIDRIACPWLIARFVDKEPEFPFIPSAQVTTRAVKLGAIPYDVNGVEIHARRPAADTNRLRPRAAVCRPSSISLGISHNFGNDHKMLRHGFVMYDALYAWLCYVRGETHTCNPQKTAS